MTDWKISRIVWNSNGWVKPSGRKGKSKNNETHEGFYGYGHEEWLFDFSKIIEGYHYSFLEPIRKHINSYTGNTYSIRLYTIGFEKRYWIGGIKNVEVIATKHASEIYKKYQSKGWIEEMYEQLNLIDVDRSTFHDWVDNELFNVRFKPSDVSIFDPYVEINKNNKIYQLSRYFLGNYRTEYGFDKGITNGEFKFQKRRRKEHGNKGSTSYEREFKIIENRHLHELVSKNLEKILVKKYGRNNVQREHAVNYGNHKIDMVVKEAENRLVFYEIKTYTNLLSVIREAFGQLMEYCCFPNQMNATELIIISTIEPEDYHIEYLNHIRDKFGVPIFYQFVNMDHLWLSKKF